MGKLPVDICAVSNIEVYGYHISGEYVKIERVLTCLSGRRCGRGAVVSGIDNASVSIVHSTCLKISLKMALQIGPKYVVGNMWK